ncbi:heavy metal translocating P-type ATPase (plasmid) [Rubrobacter marinus]|uniref:Heavy metal translocating P-type ATPase n=1 Tax=Rubrobacter marinus TaxID=2653852 RepID=A0A6G8Q3H9_9ACTN|nr:cation-translocating P-type ATPase [Rubrobacter marinus]QIN81054.1 heavy metal translocating P-type ATPase [Rubrobacter marinus]
MKKRQLPVFQPDQGPNGTPEQPVDPGCTDGCCAPAGENAEGTTSRVESPARRPQDGSGCTDGCCAPSGGDASAPVVVPLGPRRDDAGPVSTNAERTVVRVTGMDCASCAATVEKRVGQLPGVYKATVNFAAGRLDARHDPGVEPAEIERAVEKAGYGVERPGEAEHASFWRQPRVLLTLAGGLLFALGAVLWLLGLPGWASSGAYAAAIAVGGLPIFRAALSSVRARNADINVLMSVAVVGAALIGAWGEAALVVVLFALSNALQVYAVDRTRGAVRALARLAPDEVLVRRDGGEVLLAVEEVRVGDTMIVRPGERVAVDGEVVEGSSALDESPVTGESTPAEKGIGEEVFSGSLNGSGGLLVRVSREAGESTLQKITRMVEEAQGTKAPIEQFVERFSRIYTPVVIAAAVAVAAVPPLLFGGEFATWFYRALVLLIVACPCALVISTPVSVVSGIGAASRRGVLIKGGEALEATGRLKTLFFDKTGTLTEGRPVVEHVIAVGEAGEAEALGLAGALERRSEHPLAHAILSAAEGRELPEVKGFRSIAGRGAEGEIGGKRFLVGSPRLFDERGVPLDDAAAALGDVEEAGQTPVILGTKDGPIAVFGLADSIRPDAEAALRSLREVGVEDLVMLTGDAEAPARRIARRLGIDYRARLLPEDKVEAVREAVAREGASGKKRAVGMVGDGINDAPALAAADVSFAMGAAGADVALEAADVALMSDDLLKLAEAVRLSRSADRTIKQNIFVSILLNGIFTVLAPVGLVPLWLAVLEDAVSSVGVTANSLRLFRGKGARAADSPRRAKKSAATADPAAARPEAAASSCDDPCCAGEVRTGVAVEDGRGR